MEVAAWRCGLAVADYIHCGVSLPFCGIITCFYYGNTPYISCYCGRGVKVVLVPDGGNACIAITFESVAELGYRILN
jgi:hypothetical protein